MLDKSIPWHSFIMSRCLDDLPECPRLPEGFSLRSYRNDDDERAWAEIETAVGEFDSVDEAIACHKNYLASIDELYKRQWFVVNNQDKPVATCTVWWSGEDKIPCIHAFSCLPSYQHLGLGTAVAVQALHTARELHPNQHLWLETQTWSRKAIGLYLRLGFTPRRKATFNQTPNDYYQSLPLLMQKMNKETLALLMKAAID